MFFLCISFALSLYVEIDPLSQEGGVFSAKLTFVRRKLFSSLARRTPPLASPSDHTSRSRPTTAAGLPAIPFQDEV